jgi:uncharacterized caspase-like protein
MSLVGGLSVILLFAAFFSPAEAEGQKRVALVIGNGAYVNAPSLPNPPNDARDVAALLRALDFDVIEAIDLDRAAFITAVGSFLGKAASAPAALLYYGGHGVQYNDDNYLIATDAKLESIYSLKTEAFSLKEILAELEAVSSVNLIFLDACRNNPLADSLSRSIKTRGGVSPIGRGLARVAPNSANTFIAFAAAPGEVALDGVGRNSPFAQAFLKNVEASNDDVMALFKGVIRDVMGATDGKQRPQMVSGMTVDFFFHGDTTITVNPPPPEAQAAYEAAAKIGTKAAYQSIIDSFPNTVQAKLAAAAIAKMTEVAVLTPPVETSPIVPPPVVIPPAVIPPSRKAEDMPPAAGTELASLSPELIEAGLKLSQPQMKEIRLALERLGYKPGGDAAAFGSATRDAIASYQAAVGIQGSGFVSPPLLASLGIPYGAGADRQTADARKYTVASLGPDADPRLVKAITALSDTELRFGYFNQHLYVAVLKEAAWQAAKELSERAGGHLVTITSKKEQDFVIDLFLADERFTFMEPDTFLNGPWIGLFQAKGAREPKGGWQWVTGEPVTFTNWSPWAPDNHTAGENFGRFWGATKKGPEKRAVWWDDGEGDAEFRGFIMEVD